MFSVMVATATPNRGPKYGTKASVIAHLKMRVRCWLRSYYVKLPPHVVHQLGRIGC